jgi:hypothetical protein
MLIDNMLYLITGEDYTHTLIVNAIITILITAIQIINITLEMNVIKFWDSVQGQVQAQVQAQVPIILIVNVTTFIALIRIQPMNPIMENIVTLYWDWIQIQAPRIQLQHQQTHTSILQIMAINVKDIMIL